MPEVTGGGRGGCSEKVLTLLTYYNLQRLIIVSKAYCAVVN
jgi:hypothetical protein